MKSLLAVLRIELKRVLALRPVLSVLILGPLIYALYYPQPYRNEALRDVPIALVDLERVYQFLAAANEQAAAVQQGCGMRNRAAWTAGEPSTNMIRDLVR